MVMQYYCILTEILLPLTALLNILKIPYFNLNVDDFELLKHHNGKK